MSTPTIITQIADEGFEALAAKGIHALLFPMESVSGNIQANMSKNILCGYPIGNINTSGENVDQEEFQDQIRGGNYKNFFGGAIDPGDITFSAYFDPNRGKPDIRGVENSMMITPQFALILARVKLPAPWPNQSKTTPTSLQAFFSAGVNYAGGMEIKGDYGKAIGSSLKFKITGKPTYGYEEHPTLIPYSLYTAGATLIASAGAPVDPLSALLGSEIPA